MTVEQFAPLMFLGLILVMLIGFPVAFSLAALGLFSGLYAIDMGWFPANFLGNLPLNVFGILSNELLLAIPFFTLMGALLEKCGLAEDMLDSMGQLFGPIKGGLGYSVIIVGFILGWMKAPGRGRALGVGEVKFTGEVLPTASKVTYHIEMKRVILRRLVMGIADGIMKVDGKPIYEALDMKVGLFQAAMPQANAT